MEQYPKPLPRAFFVAVFAALLLLVIGSWLYYRSELKRHNAFVTSELQAIADLKTQQIIDWRNERLSDANFLFSSPDIREYVSLLDHNPNNQAIEKQLRDRLNAMYINNKYSIMRVYDHTKTLRLSLPKKDIHSSDTFYRHQDSAASIRSIVVYDFHLPPGDTVHLEILIPFFHSSNSAFAGCVVLTINPYKNLYPMLKNFPSHSQTVECVLARAEDDSVVIINELRLVDYEPLQYRESIHSKTLPAAMAVRNEFGIREGIDYRGKRVLAAVQGLPGTGWGLVVKVDRDEIDRPFFERMLMVLAISLLMVSLFIALLAYWWQRRRNDQRIQMYEIEKEKIASELSYRSLFENMLNGYAYHKMIFDENDTPIDYTFLSVNQAFETQTGLKNVVGKNVCDVIPGIRSGSPELFEIYGKVAKSGIPHRFESYLAPLQQWFDISVFSPKDDHFVVVFDNITERRNSMEALKTSEERLRAFFESNLFGTILGDIYGGIYEANEEFCRIIGYSRDEIIDGKVKWDEITPPEFISADTKGIDEARAFGVCSPYEKQYIRKDGSHIWVLVGYILLGQERERSAAFILDISRVKSAEEQLRKLNVELEQRVEQRTEALTLANKELEAFSYSVSHDLRAPLRAIDGFSRIINEDYGKQLDSEAKRLLEVIRNNAKKMAQLIDDLLSFSRVGRSNLLASSVSMTEMVRAMYYEYTNTAQREKILFTLNPLPDAFGDPTLLRQVWANLLSNAIKFTSKKPQSKIEVSGEIINDEVVYTIRDNGAGFDMRYHEKLFGVFQRLHSPSEFEGTGVGLAIVQRIIHRHHGRVWAESIENEGATFYFSLPIQEKLL
ncbi:MAG: ATP-binding protein [bacterium]|nr:ATP-binding protein [bacterium]